MDPPTLVRFLTGLVVLVGGAEILVRGASALAERFGVSKLVVGLTVVVFGTSAPELAVSIQSALAGRGELALGNVVGSNAFNLLGVLGITAAVAPAPIPVPAAVVAFDLPVMTAVAVACLPVFFTGGTIARWEGVLFLGYYLAYLAFLFLDASGHAAADEYGAAMIVFVIPITVITLAVVTLREVRLRR